MERPVDPPVMCRKRVPLSPLTTLELGGPAEVLAEVRTEAEICEVLRWAGASGRAATILGGGSNVVVSDDGVAGVVLRLASRGIEVEEPGDGTVLVTAAAGEPWDDLVAETVARGLAGLECLSGIPGTVGATPIQNVGAYGAEVAEVIERVRVLDRLSLEPLDLTPGDCAFAYRWSRFRAEPERFVVTTVSFRLRRGPAAPARYAELARRLGGGDIPPAEVREAVLDLRRCKSMVLDPEDPNRRSVGSFFVNPVVGEERWPELVRRARAAGVVAGEAEIPTYPAGGGRKLAAGWLVERAGIARGLRRGPVGVSTNHALCLVHHGGGRTADLVALAREVRDRVHQIFGVDLRAEPAFVGFDRHPLAGTP